MVDPLWLKLAWCHEGLQVDGLDERGRYRTTDDFCIGRSPSCELQVRTTRGLLLGGRRSYAIMAYQDRWSLHHGGHVGRARVDGERLRESLPLSVGSVIELDIVGSATEEDFVGDVLGLRLVCEWIGRLAVVP